MKTYISNAAMVILALAALAACSKENEVRPDSSLPDGIQRYPVNLWGSKRNVSKDEEGNGDEKVCWLRA